MKGIHDKYQNEHNTYLVHEFGLEQEEYDLLLALVFQRDTSSWLSVSITILGKLRLPTMATTSRHA